METQKLNIIFTISTPSYVRMVTIFTTNPVKQKFQDYFALAYRHL